MTSRRLKAGASAGSAGGRNTDRSSLSAEIVLFNSGGLRKPWTVRLHISVRDRQKGGADLEPACPAEWQPVL